MTTLLIADPHPLTAETLARVLTCQHGFTVPADRPATGAALARALARHRPAVALVACALVGGPDPARGQAPSAAPPDTRILHLSPPEQTPDMEACRAAGAVGVVSQSLRVDAVVAAVRAVLSGQDPVVHGPPPPTSTVDHDDREPDPQVHLTPRQRQALQLVHQGLSTRAIATRLHLAPGTVDNHIQSCLKALGARSRREAVHLARKHGLLD